MYTELPSVFFGDDNARLGSCMALCSQLCFHLFRSKNYTWKTVHLLLDPAFYNPVTDCWKPQEFDLTEIVKGVIQECLIIKTI